MSSIVYQIDKKTGAKYAFESISYWDKDKKQPRSKRKPGHENQGMSEDVIIKKPKHGIHGIHAAVPMWKSFLYKYPNPDGSDSHGTGGPSQLQH